MLVEATKLESLLMFTPKRFGDHRGFFAETYSARALAEHGIDASLLDAGNFVRTLEERQGLQTGSPDEIAYAQGWISDAELIERAKVFGKNAYGRYLEQLLDRAFEIPKQSVTVKTDRYNQSTC